MPYSMPSAARSSAGRSTQTAAPVTNALGMAIRGRDPDRTVIHSDRGTQFMSWTFIQRVKEAELMPSVGRTGTALDNAMMEFFWGRMQVELFNRRRWKTRVELPTRSSNTSSCSTTTADATARSICSRQRSLRNSIRENPAGWILIRSGRCWGLDQAGPISGGRAILAAGEPTADPQSGGPLTHPRRLARREGRIKVRLIKMIGLAAVAALAAMAFVEASSASAESTAFVAWT